MGPVMSHIVIPLPSGVITAPNITKIITEYLKFFRQNEASVTPVKEIAYIKIGSSNAIPMPKETVKQMK